MPTPIASQIRTRVHALADELAELIQAFMVAEITSAIGGGAPPRSARGRGRGRPRGTAASSTRRRRKGQKRNPKLLAATTERLAAYIAKNPGKRIEEISKGLSTPTRDLALPAKKLLAGRKIKTRGQKRATKYYPGRQ